MNSTQENLKIAVLIGSLRKESYNRKLADAAAKLAPDNLSFEILQIDHLPFYNSDLEGDQAPKSWRQLRDQVRQADGVLFFTPEYNRSTSAVLKNAIEVASRPYDQNAWSGKPGALISSSMGQLGAFGANHHLRQIMTGVNIATMAHPEAYISNTAQLFDETGELINESTRDFLRNYMAAFEAWVRQNH